MRLFSVLGLTAVMISASNSITQGAIVNRGFETGNFSGWTQSGNTDYTGVASNIVYAHSGNFLAYLGAADSLGYLSQFIPTDVDQTYQLSYFLKSFDGEIPNRFQSIVNGITLFDQENIENRDYTKYVHNFVAKAASTELKFGFQNDYGFLLLDDVNVKSVPEPLTLGGTLVAGAIALLRKLTFIKKR